MDKLLTWHCQGVCPHSSCFLSVVRGIRNGAVYGSKVRFPHALVMTFLFGSGSIQDKTRRVFKATYHHGRNLACFVGLYKTILCLMRHIRQKNSGINNLVAGAIGGGIMFGDGNSPVNSQINMYILSRITHGLARTAVNHGYLFDFKNAFTLYAAVCWGIVMYLFDYEKGTLQRSLISSMTYLYQDSNSWPENTDSIWEWFTN